MKHPRKTERLTATATPSPRAWAALCVLLLGCNPSVQGGGDSDGAANPDGSAAFDLSAAPDLRASASPDAGNKGDGGDTFCTGSGPPLLREDSPDGGASKITCSGDLAQVAFRYALCTCEDLSSSANLTTSAYDSQMAMSPKNLGGSIGNNGRFATQSPVAVAGSLWVASVSGLNVGQLAVGQELRSGGPLAGQGPVTVGSGAYVAGDLTLNGAFSAVGGLTIPTGKNVSAMNITGTVTRAPVTVAPPCDCDPAHLIDIAGYIHAYSALNENASAGLSADQLTHFTGGASVTLPCGHFYLDGIAGTGPVQIQVNGRAVLFVAGDVALQDNLTITLGATGELDLFIGGNLTSSAALKLGDPSAAARLRIYVGGSGTINLQGQSAIAANIYAPRAELVTSADLDVSGALFVRRLAAQAKVQINHDTAIFRAGMSCPADGETGCASCRDCGNQACVAGVCGACTDSSQCCSPLECIKGQCVYNLG